MACVSPADPPTRVAVRPAHPAYPVGLVLIAVFSVQFGGAAAVVLIGAVGVLGAVALRLSIAALVMVAATRPRIRGYTRSDWLVVAAFGLSLAAMNTAFYGSIARLPVGVAVTIEFIGPLGLAAALSRRWLDGAAVAVAAAGVLLTSNVLTEPLADIDLVGILLALVAGLCWACYILLSERTGRRFPGAQGVAWAMVVGAAVMLPLGLVPQGTALFEPRVLGLGLAIATLSSALPYSLELISLRYLDPRVFGILLSLEPAAAALAGFLVLGQLLAPLQVGGMALVVLASAAVTVTQRRAAKGSLAGETPPTGPSQATGSSPGPGPGPGTGSGPGRGPATDPDPGRSALS